jgi:4-amino-4-deoxy-L-arabinose transferase-like glycosyltransferase
MSRGQRPPRGAVAAGVGAVVLLLALALPWISLPGGPFAVEILTQRGDPVPATGHAWRSLPLLSVVLLGLAGLGGLVAVTSVAAPRWREVVAGLTAACGLLVLAVLVVKLFTSRVADDQTALGAGAYLGLLAVAVIVAGALTVIRDLRVPPAPRPPRPAPAAPGAPARPPGHLLAAGALALVATYLVTRISFVDRFPYFFDEGIYADHALAATESGDDLFIALEIGQGPLVTWLSAGWVELGFPPLTAVRVVSLISGLLTVGAIGLLARQLWDATTGWVAATLCVIVPFFVVHDGIGIYEPLVTLIMASALLLQIALARRPDVRVATLLGVVLAAGLLTKQSTLPALALLPVSLLCFDWSQPGLRRRLTVWLTGVAIVLVLVAAAEAVQRSSPYWDEREEAVADILIWPVRSVDAVLDHPFALLDQNWDTYRPAVIGYLTVPLLLAAAAGAALAWRQDRRTTAVLLAWVVLPFMVGILFQLRPAPRHAMFLMPPLLVLAAHAIVSGARLAGRRLDRRAAAAACAVGTVVLVLPAVIFDGRVLAHPDTAHYPSGDYWQYVAGWPAGGPWKHTTELIERRASGRRVVILTPGPYDTLRLSLDDSDRYRFVTPDAALADRAHFAVFDTAGFPVEPKGFAQEASRRGFGGVARYSRPVAHCIPRPGAPCGGTVVVLDRR